MVRERALAKKLVVGGWWLLVNEREGVPRWGKACAARTGLDDPPLFLVPTRPPGGCRMGGEERAVLVLRIGKCLGHLSLRAKTG